MKAQRRHRGFTLVEALVTVVIVGIIMVALWQALAILVRGAGLVKQRAQASQIAANHLEEAVATWDWQNGASGDDSPNYDDSLPAMYHWDVQSYDFNEPNGTPDLHQVECVVTWTAHGQDYSVTLSTLMFDDEKVAPQTTATQ